MTNNKEVPVWLGQKELNVKNLVSPCFLFSVHHFPWPNLCLISSVHKTDVAELSLVSSVHHLSRSNEESDEVSEPENVKKNFIKIMFNL